MEFMIIVLLFLLVMIMSKLSNIENQLEKIEDSLKRGQKPVLKEKITEKINETINKKIYEKPVVIKPKRVTPIIKQKPQPNIMDNLKERFDDTSFEEILFGNIILKIAIVAFILGIGFFLKYSIDRDWIPVWGRVLIGIVVGISMLIGGIRMIDNRHKLFSETLFGGGIAVLYLSIFVAFSLEEFKFIDVNYAFVAMIAITILAGVISIRFDAKSTAIFGLIGGFATPFLLSTGSGNYVGLLSYMLILNLGVLYISIYKKWSLLSWMAFGITSFTGLSIVWNTQGDFVALSMLYATFFLIYSIVPFINEIKEQKKSLVQSSVFLFWANFIVVILSFLALFEHYGVELIYYALVTVVLAGYLLTYASFLAKKSVLLKDLFYIVLAQSIALLLVTPAFIFSGSSLTIVWAVESLMLLWIATKSGEKTYGLFALLGFGITVVQYLFSDMMNSYAYMERMHYIQTLAVTSFFVIGSFFVAYRLLKNSKFDFEYFSLGTVRFTLFLVAFGGAYLVSTILSSLLTGYYEWSIFSMLSMLIIALFAFLLYRSDYTQEAKSIFTLFLGLMMLNFTNNIMSISTQSTAISILNFLFFIGIVGFIYTLAFKESTLKLGKEKLSNLMLGAGVGLLFIFLNVEVYHLVKLYNPLATKFSMTLLWVIFGIALFVYGVLKDIKISKMVGTVLIFIAILKAFFFDLANLDSIYRIVLFLILGAILFGLSYFYQKNREREI
ncbi:MAG: hypothetical protein DSZ11_05770 [Sulfurovum sp.]|nr:MAG: hypothetical protein DSZ11_05770 [Sulfurovum sp.]